jgi:hypothetical protein
VLARKPRAGSCNTGWIAVAGPSDTSQARGDAGGCPAARKGIGNDILWEAEQSDTPFGQHFAEGRWGIGVTRAGEAPQSARPAQVKPGLVRHRGRAGSVPGAVVEDQHRLDGRSHVGGAGGIDTAAIRAGSSLKFVPENLESCTKASFDGPIFCQEIHYLYLDMVRYVGCNVLCSPRNHDLEPACLTVGACCRDSNVMRSGRWSRQRPGRERHRRFEASERVARLRFLGADSLFSFLSGACLTTKKHFRDHEAYM